MLSTVRPPLLVLALVLSGGCRGFAPPEPELLARLERRAEGGTGPERRTARLEVEGEDFAGDFTAVLVTDGAPRPSARLQLLPEVGPKVLDLVARPDALEGSLPGEPYSHARGDAPPPLHPLAILACCVLEDVAPLAPRVAGARETTLDDGSPGLELSVEPVLEGCEVTALVDASGAVRERRFRLGRARWREVCEGDRRAFLAPGTRWVLRDETRAPIEAPPRSLFRLSPAPAGSAPGAAARP